MSHCLTYTYAVVLRPSGLVVEREVFLPPEQEAGNGAGKSGLNGAPAPQSRESLSAASRCSSLLGVKRQSGAPGNSIGLGTFSVHSPAEFCAGKFAVRGIISRHLNVRDVLRTEGAKRANVFAAGENWPGENPDQNEISGS
jgi:hypothetical protein